MMILFGFIMVMTPIIFFISLAFDDVTIWDAIKLTIFVDLGIAMLGLGLFLIMFHGGFPPQ